MVNISECINKTYGCWCWINGNGNLNGKSHVKVLNITPKGFANCELQCDDGFTKKFRSKIIAEVGLEIIDYKNKNNNDTIQVYLNTPYFAQKCP